jgi:hypothetical protein
MTTRIKIKKGAGTPSGLTFGELAYDVTNKRLFIGITGGNALLSNTDGGVATFNGLTGPVTGVTVGGTNVFTALNSFNAGISAAGATFSGDIAVNGGDITTTSTTATLYNTNATTVNIGNAASTVGVMGATADARLNIGSNSYVKTGSKYTTTTTKQEIFSYIAVAPPLANTYFADIIITANYGGGIGGSISSQITKMLVATSYNTSINHTEYGNVNTAGNLAVYTAEISGNNVIIYATPTSSSALFPTVFNAYATLIKGSHGANTEE